MIVDFYLDSKTGFYEAFEALDDDTQGIPMNFKSIMNYDLSQAATAKVQLDYVCL